MLHLSNFGRVLSPSVHEPRGRTAADATPLDSSRNTSHIAPTPVAQVLHRASDLCEHRRRGLRHASTTMTAPNNGSTSTSAGRRSVQPNSFLRCSFLAAAAMVAILPSPAGARDTFTVSAGYQHSCIVTADASVKVRGNAQDLRGVYFLAPSVSGLSVLCVGRLLWCFAHE